MKTRAAVAWEAGKPLEIESVEIDGPKEGEVLLRNVATGVCHTDEFITHTIPLEDINTAFDLMYEGKSIRSVVHF